MKKFFGLIAPIFALQVGYAANHYVATTGNDTNPGTLASPWKTIQKAVNASAAGSTVFVRGGTYNEKVNFTKSGNAASGFITLQNYNNETVVVDASNIAGNSDNIFYLYNKNYIRIKGLEFQNCVVPNNHDGAAIFIEGNADHIEILNCKIHDITGDNAMGITIYGTNKTKSIQNLVIDGNEIYDCEPAPSEALTLNGNIRLFQITNNKVHDVNNIGIDMIGGEGTCPKAANDNARNGVCSGNEVYNARSVYGGGYAAGIYVDGGDTIILERNSVHDSDLGMEIGCENKGKVATNNIIRDNIFYHNDKRGLSFGGYDYPNTGKVQYCKFYNNTCYMNDVLNVDEGELLIEYANNCEVKNNIFYGTGNSYLMNFYFTNTSGNTFDYNCWYVNSGSTKFIYDGVQYNSFVSYKNNSGQDSHAVNSDPLFSDAANHDFHLNALSPCKDAGDPSILPATGELDFYGASRFLNNHMDIGADEFDPNGKFMSPETVESSDVIIYPTIVKDQVHVSFALDREENVDITLLNLSGASVNNLLHGDLSSGNYDFSYNLKGLTSGIYFLQIQAGDKSAVRRIMVSN